MIPYLTHFVQSKKELIYSEEDKKSTKIGSLGVPNSLLKNYRLEKLSENFWKLRQIVFFHEFGFVFFKER